MRVRGWLALREGQAGPEAARAFMAEAVAECERAPARGVLATYADATTPQAASRREEAEPVLEHLRG
ncbi:hypothetical protein [Streptomyces violascens]|uniref:hypothetical protein n=1 Tax=Streptomyces violascens TaxID=67381 RepID=UPI00364D50FF